MKNTPYKSPSCRPRDHLAAAAKECPTAWKLADFLRKGRGGLYNWPDWCYLPFCGWYAIVNGDAAKRRPINRLGEFAAIGIAVQLCSLGAWRETQGIYRFDPALFEAIVDTSLEGDLPCDIFHYLPEWCVYVETPGLQCPAGVLNLNGFFAHLEWDDNTRGTELRLLLDSDEGLTPISLHLGPWSLTEALDRAIKSSYQLPNVDSFSDLGIDDMSIVDTVESLRASVGPLLSLLLYLCSKNAEIGDGSRKPANPTPKKTRKGLRLFAPDKPTTWDVGVRMGTAIRRAQVPEVAANDGTHAGPRPHFRRAHWHGFRSGPNKDTNGMPIQTESRKFSLRWLPPIMVNLDSVDDLPATIRPMPFI